MTVINPANVVTDDAEDPAGPPPGSPIAGRAADEPKVDPSPATDGDSADDAAPAAAPEPQPAAAAAPRRSFVANAKNRMIDDTLLPKMYKLFTAADDGLIDLADAGLSAEEFEHRLSIDKLEETLAPIGGLDLSRVDAALKELKGLAVDLKTVFAVLDADGNDRVTCKEFLALITKVAPKAFAKVVEDSALQKMYRLFTKADAGKIDVADAGLTKHEFVATITLERLQETLAPVGGLDMARIDPKFSGNSSELPIDQIFAMLDKNGDDRVTMTEFVKLLRKKAATK